MQWDRHCQKKLRKEVEDRFLYDKQFGFRKSHSTNHALNYSISHIKSELKKGNHVLGIFIDLSKAFDTMDHRILIKKLEHYGVRCSVLSLLTSYLQATKQTAKCLSSWRDHRITSCYIWCTTRKLFRSFTFSHLHKRSR